MALKLRVQNINLTDTSEHWFARAHICVSALSPDRDGNVLLTPDCRTAGEIVAYADDLIKELENIKREAKRVTWNSKTAADATQ